MCANQNHRHPFRNEMCARLASGNPADPLSHRAGRWLAKATCRPNENRGEKLPDWQGVSTKPAGCQCHHFGQTQTTPCL